MYREYYSSLTLNFLKMYRQLLEHFTGNHRHISQNHFYYQKKMSTGLLYIFRILRLSSFTRDRSSNQVLRDSKDISIFVRSIRNLRVFQILSKYLTIKCADFIFAMAQAPQDGHFEILEAWFDEI